MYNARMRITSLVTGAAVALAVACGACGDNAHDAGNGSDDALPAACVELIQKTHACIDKLTGAERDRALQGIMMLEEGWHNPENRPPDIGWQCQTLLTRGKHSASYKRAGCDF